MLVSPEFNTGDPAMDKALQDAYTTALTLLSGQGLAIYTQVNNNASLLTVSFEESSGSDYGAEGSASYVPATGGIIPFVGAALVQQAQESGVDLSVVVASQLYHELIHVQQDIQQDSTGYSLDLVNKELEAYTAQAAFDQSIGYTNSIPLKIMAGYKAIDGNCYTGKSALFHYFLDRGYPINWLPNAGLG
ncbi:MAG: hypothetical protein ACYCW6_15825 [Candidatus Xenobia bacterium]